MSHVKAEAKRSGKSVHFARLFELMGLKHSELSQDKQKWRARVVIQGDGIQDHEGQAAVFQELSSSASLMSASKLVDIIGMQPGYSVQQADAIRPFPRLSSAVMKRGLSYHLTVDPRSGPIYTHQCVA